jgi:hypothetical protein
MLQCGRLCLDKGVLDRPHDLRWKDRSLVHGSGHRLLPSFEHAFHGSPHISVYESVGFHVRAIQTASKVDGVRRSDVLHY